MKHRAILALHNVTRRYGPVLGLNDVTVEIGPGITGLVGPNGAGKTTFLNLAVGLHRPSSGKVSLLDADPFFTPAVRAQTGYCPDGERTWDWMEGRNFVLTLARWSGLSPAEAEERVDPILESLELTAASRKPVATYSRGMRQKLKVAQAVIHEPRFLVLDEPLNGVDPLSRHQILKMLQQYVANGAAVLVSSHVLHELGSFADQVVLLQRGRLLASGTVDSIRDLLDEHPHTVRIACSRARPLAAALLSLDGTVSVELSDTADSVKVRTRNPASFYSRLPELIMKDQLEVTELAPLDSDLDSVFNYLVKGGGG